MLLHSRSGFQAPAQDVTVNRYFDDIETGEVWTSRFVELSEEEIIVFGRQYDPQFFHVDPVAAAKGPFGSIVASGWQLTSIAMREMILGKPDGDTPIVGIGADEIRWLRPVRAGVRFAVRREIVSKKASASRPDRGTVKSAFALIDEAGTPLMTFTTLTIIPCRPAGGGA